MKSLRAGVLLAIVFCGCEDSPVTSGPVTRGLTAMESMEQVNLLAASYGRDLRLMHVFTHDVGTDGTSDLWAYQYVDAAAPGTGYWFHSCMDSVGFDSTGSAGVGAAVISHPWFNSSVALFVAEQNGGREFRARNPAHRIGASLGEPLVPDPATTWWISYQPLDDTGRSLFLAIDAVTGAVTLRHP